MIFNTNNNLKILAKKELFDNYILKYLLLSFNAIPINRKQLDIEALRLCIKSLNSNYNIIIFPEGTRNLKHKQVKSGVGFLSYKTNSKILPVYISPIQNKFRSNINIYLGNIIEIKNLNFIHNLKNKHEINYLISNYIIKNIYELEKNNYC